jgi:hypothetical protein
MPEDCINLCARPLIQNLHILNAGEERSTPADVHYGNNMYGNAAQYMGGGEIYPFL